MGDGLTVPGTDNLPTTEQAESTIVDLLLAHPDAVAAVIVAVVAIVFVKKYPVLSAILGTALVVVFAMKMAG